MVTYEHFVAVAALKLHQHAQSHRERDGKGGQGGDDDEPDEEVEAAFKLFTRGEGEAITIAHLKRVARELREDVADAVLKDMLREANGDQSGRVGLVDFERVMRRAGVFG